MKIGPQVGGESPLQALTDPTLLGLWHVLQQDSISLPPPVNRLAGEIARHASENVSGVATNQLERLYRDNLLVPCRQRMQDRYPFGKGSDLSLADFGEIVGYGGLFDKFYTENIDKLVERGSGQLVWRPDSVDPSPGMLAQFERAERIRQMFFSPGSKTPELEFTVRLSALDPAAKRFYLDIHGQRFEIVPGAESVGPAQWPGKQAIVDAVFEDWVAAPERAIAPSRSAWAWFHVVDAVGPPRLDAPPNGLVSSLQFKTNHHSASATIEAQNPLRNPFARSDWTGGHFGVNRERNRRPGRALSGVGAIEVGLFGKLPSRGDFLRRRASDAFVDAWDAWLRECLTASREALGERWLDLYLTSPALALCAVRGTCGPAPVIGTMVPSVDRVGRYFPLTLVANLPADSNLITAALGSSAFFERAERLVIDTLAVDEVDFERFDEQVVLLADALEPLLLPPRLVLDSGAAATVMNDASLPCQIQIGSMGDLHVAFEQMLSARLASLYHPWSLWWTDGSAAVDPSCLIARGLPNAEAFVALLDGTWDRHRWRFVPATIDTSATLEMLVDRIDVGVRSAAATDVGLKRSINEDAYIERAEVGMWAVADGLGGHRDGEVASHMVAMPSRSSPRNRPSKRQSRRLVSDCSE